MSSTTNSDADLAATAAETAAATAAREAAEAAAREAEETTARNAERERIEREQEEREQVAAPYNRIYWDGNLSTPTGTIAAHYNKPIPEQMDACERMATFLKQDSRIIDNLNVDASLTPFLINVPDNRRKLRVLYGVGTGCGLNGLGSNPLHPLHCSVSCVVPATACLHRR